MSDATVSSDFRRRIDLAGAQKHAAGSTAERFRELLLRGREALDGGSYGIAAAFCVRDGASELTFFGRNTIAGGDPAGHAEMNALGLATRLLALPAAQRPRALGELQEAGAVTVRTCSPADRETVLYSTLEPCPMCTVATINAGVGRVIYAHEDPIAGAMAPARLCRLAPIWPELATTVGLRVVSCQTVRETESESYLPPDLWHLLDELFVTSREQLDAQLAHGGFFDPYALTQVSRAAPPS